MSSIGSKLKNRAQSAMLVSTPKNTTLSLIHREYRGEVLQHSPTIMFFSASSAFANPQQTQQQHLRFCDATLFSSLTISLILALKQALFLWERVNYEERSLFGQGESSGISLILGPLSWISWFTVESSRCLLVTGYRFWWDALVFLEFALYTFQLKSVCPSKV